MTEILISIVAFLLAIGVLVAVHEFGHYIVARWIGVRVLRFSVGFGKPLLARRWGKDQTEYCIAAIPIGGYVKLLDESEGEVAPHEVHRAFNRQSVAGRVAVLLAGPLMNFVFAILAYWMMFVIGIPGAKPIIGEVAPTSIAWEAGVRPLDHITGVGGRDVTTWEGATFGILDQLLSGTVIPIQVTAEDGLPRDLTLDVAGQISTLTEPGQLLSGLGVTPWSPVIPAVIDQVMPGSPAEAAGMLPGDLVLVSGGMKIESWMEWVKFIRERPDESVAVTVLRDGAEVDLDLHIGAVEAGGAVIGRIEASARVTEEMFAPYQAEQRYGLLESMPAAIDKTWEMSELTVRMVGRMFTGDVSVKNISGPVNIAQFAGYSATSGPSSFLAFLAIVSLSLGILNLLPVPMLDGGHIVFSLLEGIKGSPLSEKTLLIGQQIGIVFLMLIMSFAFYNDLTRIFS